MKLYLVKTPKFVQRVFSKRIWAFPNKKKPIYLTFDDGPTPQVTSWVLEQLKNHQAEATFFCIGNNIDKYPAIFKQIISEGHSVGNHTYNHLNGWKTPVLKYVNDVLKNETCISEFRNQKSELLFRPPFGKLRSKQSKLLQKKGYKIIMWDVLSADFDTTISNKKCLENVIKNINPGSIIVFHDSLKAEDKLKYVLPKVLDFIAAKKWKCTRI